MNNEKIVNRVNPTDNEDAVTKKYVDEKKTKQNNKKNRNNRFILFFVKICPQSLIIDAFIKEKATCWYHTGHDSNSELHHSKNYSVTAYDQSGLIKHATLKINLTQTKKINFNIYIKNIIYNIYMYNVIYIIYIQLFQFTLSDQSLKPTRGTAFKQ